MNQLRSLRPQLNDCDIAYNINKLTLAATTFGESLLPGKIGIDDKTLIIV